jgi:hypothetical protein
VAWSRKVRRHKYDAQRTVFDGVTYDSKAEATRARELNLLEAAGEIGRWKRQVPVELVQGFTCRVDFLVFTVDNTAEHFEEVKGMETQRSRDIRRLWEHHGPLPLVILKRNGNGWKREVIEGKS